MYCIFTAWLGEQQTLLGARVAGPRRRWLGLPAAKHRRIHHQPPASTFHGHSSAWCLVWTPNRGLFTWMDAAFRSLVCLNLISSSLGFCASFIRSEIRSHGWITWIEAGEYNMAIRIGVQASRSVDCSRDARGAWTTQVT